MYIAAYICMSEDGNSAGASASQLYFFSAKSMLRSDQVNVVGGGGGVNYVA